MKRVLIIGYQRSGTTALAKGLGAHPEIAVCPHEIHAPSFFGRGIDAFTINRLPPDGRGLGRPRLFDALALSDRPDSAVLPAVAGLKCAINSCETATLVTECFRREFAEAHLILCSREDLVAQCASLHLAGLRGKFHSWEGAAESPAPRFRIDVERFASYAARCRAAIHRLRSLADSHRIMEVHYETGYGDFGALLRRCFAFLGVDPDLESRFSSEKVSPPVREFVTNYEELYRELERIDALPVERLPLDPPPPRLLWRLRNKAWRVWDAAKISSANHADPENG